MICFNNEDEFNRYLKEEGEKPLLAELRNIIPGDYSRCSIKETLYGDPDHIFYSPSTQSLLFVECAEKLDKRHIGKDFLYLFYDLPGKKIKSKIIFWITSQEAPKQIIEMIQKIRLVQIIGVIRPEYFISSPMEIFPQMRLNIQSAFGTRKAAYTDTDVVTLFQSGNSMYYSYKALSMKLGIPYTTTIMVVHRFCSDAEDHQISDAQYNRMIAKIEKEASARSGTDLTGRFVPIHQKSSEMLFRTEANQIAGIVGNKIRRKIKPEWVTLCGAARFRLLYSREKVKRLKSF
jgi:hypothetical protein